MNTSESITSIAPALLKAQMTIKFATKDATNPHFKSKYADLPSVIDAVKPALNNAGIVFLQFLSPSDLGTIAITTRLQHVTGEWFESVAVCPLPKSDPQGYGSACTYLRRYSLASAVGLYQDDDDGAAASKTNGDAAKESTASTPNAGAGDGMTAKRKSEIIDIAVCAKDFLKEGSDFKAYEFLEEQALELDDKLYLWAQFNSKERAAIKRMQAADKTRSKPETANAI